MLFKCSRDSPLVVDAEAGQARDGVARHQLLQADHALALRVAQHVLCNHNNKYKYNLIVHMKNDNNVR